VESLTKQEIEQVFCKAAEIIEQPDAFIQGGYSNAPTIRKITEGTCFCAQGACIRAAVDLGLAPDGLDALELLDEALWYVNDKWRNLPAYNDHDGRTAAQAAAHLRELAQEFGA
jgi:hypothetical protein